MMQTERYRTELTYDPNETFEQLGARRQHALQQGRQAVRERHISGDLYLFYEHLIERVGANNYTWIGEDTLAEVFSVDASTIKRWIAKLVRAGLIRRQRQFGTTSRTYITAYDPATPLLDGEAEDTAEMDATQATPGAEQTKVDPMPAQEDSDTAGADISFRRTDAPTFGADLPPDHIKDSHLTLGGGGTEISRKNQAVAPEIQLLLEREGVMTFYLAPMIQQKPLDELRAVSRYLDQQHNIRDRARLFAALAVQGFGGLLLAGRAQRPPQATQRGNRPPTAQPPRGDDHLKYVSGALAPYIQGGMTHGDTPATTDRVPVVAPPVAQSAAIPVQIWHQALDRLRQTLSASEIATWFADAHLLQLEDDQAVIGTPNIFARDTLVTWYQAQIAQALSASCGRPVHVQIELGGS